jgi:hypothetical protein
MMDRLVKKALKTTETVKILYFPKIVFLNRFSGTVLAFIKKRKTFTRGGDTMRNLFKHLVAAAVVGVLSANVFAATTIVYSNNPAPGDLFTNSLLTKGKRLEHLAGTTIMSATTEQWAFAPTTPSTATALST